MTSNERPGGIEDQNSRDGIDNPDIRQGVDNPDLPQGVGNPDIRQGVDNPDIQPVQQTTVSGLSLSIPMLVGLGAVALVVAVGAIVVLKPGGAASPTAGPGATAGPGVTAAAGATAGSAGSVGPAKDGTANLVVSGGYDGSWTLDSNSGNVSPTTALIAGVWVKTVDNVPAGYGDLIVLTVSGPISNGTVSTSQAGVVLGISITRSDSKGVDLFNHRFTSKAGECQVTMARGSIGVTGSFSCASLTSQDGKTVKATGSFAT